jgi:hypothetical protein
VVLYEKEFKAKSPMTLIIWGFGWIFKYDYTLINLINKDYTAEPTNKYDFKRDSASSLASYPYFIIEPKSATVSTCYFYGVKSDT